MEQPNPWATPSSSSRTPPPSRTPLIVGLVVGGMAMLLVIALAGGVFVFGLLKARIPTPEAAVGNPDDIVLRQEPGTGPAMRYGGVPVYDACSLVTIDALSSFGVSLSREYFVSHEHLDADVPPEAAITPGVSGSVSSCFYMLKSNDSLHVNVHQTPFNSPDELSRKQDSARFAEAAVRSAGGLSSASWYDKRYDTQHLLVWRPELLVDISVHTGDSDGTLAVDPFVTKLEGLVSRGLTAAPTAPVRHVYAAPFEKVKDPCQIATAEAFAAAFPSSTGAPSFVDGSYSIDAPVPPRGYAKARHAEFSCTRNNIVPRDNLNKDQYRSLRVDLSMWTSQQAADTSNDADCAPGPSKHGDPVAVTPAIGTDRSCLADYETDWLLKFQVDRVNVTVKDGSTADEKPDSSVRLTQLVPAARVVASAGLFR